MSAVILPDLVEWLTGWLYRELEARSEPYARGVVVSNREPDVGSANFPERLVVVGDSGSTDRDLLLSDASLRVSVLAGSKEAPKECVDLARLVHALVRDCARFEPGNPVVRVVASRGPMSVPEDHPRARRLSTFDIAVVGSPLA